MKEVVRSNAISAQVREFQQVRQVLPRKSQLRQAVDERFDVSSQSLGSTCRSQATLCPSVCNPATTLLDCNEPSGKWDFSETTTRYGVDLLITRLPQVLRDYFRIANDPEAAADTTTGFLPYSADCNRKASAIFSLTHRIQHAARPGDCPERSQIRITCNVYRSTPGSDTSTCAIATFLERWYAPLIAHRRMCR